MNIAMVTSNVSPLESFFFEPNGAMATFRLKCKNCDNFGLYSIGFFVQGSFDLIFGFYTSQGFLFFEKGYIKGKIVPFTKATNKSSMFTTLHARGKV